MAITITPTVRSVSPAPAQADGIVLQAGQVITAQVVQILGNDQVQIAIGNQTIDAATQVPLQVGQSLQLQVSETASGIGLAIVNSPSSASSSEASQAAASNSNAVLLSPTLAASLAANVNSDAVAASPLTPVETLAVSLAAQTAATQQTSLAPLFADLGAAAGLPNLPPQVQQAVAQVLAQQTNLDQNLTGEAIKQAFQSSGLFLEASLASGAASSAAGTPDLKAALIVLRQVLATSLASAAGESAAPQAAAPSTATLQASAPADATARPPSGTAPELVTAGSTSAQSGLAAAPTAAFLSTATIAQAGPTAVQTTAPVTILAEAASEPPVPDLIGGSPPIAPQVAATGASASTESAAATLAREILDLVVAGQALTPATTQTDAGLRAAATSAALNLLQEAFQGTPVAASAISNLVLQNGELLSLVPAISPARPQAIEDPEFAPTSLPPPPPVNGALPSAQAVAAVTLSAHAPLETTLQHLLADTDGAIARQTLLQIASLPSHNDPSAARIDLSGPRWNFEIPFATPQGTAMAQFEIARDGGGREQAAKATWRARFSLNVEPAGPVHALISLVGGRTSVRIWAERPATASELRAGVSQLSQALSRADLTPGDIVIRDGAPVQPPPAAAGHFLDRAS